MKTIRFNLSLFKKILLILYVFFLFCTNSINTFAADTDHYSEETLISLDFENKSLNQVLKEISWVTGYSFAINKEYSDLKISGSLNQVPLHQGLKEILGKHSHTITYEPNKTVSLTIYESSPPTPFIKNVTNLSAPLNYTIRPMDMAPLQSEAPGEEAETYPEEAKNQWDDHEGEFQSDSNEEAYNEDEFESSAHLISPKNSARIKLKGADLGISDEYGEYEDYYEEDVENGNEDSLRYESDEE